MKSNLTEILKEQKFPCFGIDSEDRDSYLEIIKNCKDFCDSEQKVDNQSKCDLIEMELRKVGKEVRANGSVFIGTLNKKEYRHLDANIYIEENSIIVDMLVTRLSVVDEKSQYRTLDEFVFENNVLIRNSQYNYDMKTKSSKIADEKALIIIDIINKVNKKGKQI